MRELENGERRGMGMINANRQVSGRGVLKVVGDNWGGFVAAGAVGKEEACLPREAEAGVAVQEALSWLKL